MRLLFRLAILAALIYFGATYAKPLLDRMGIEIPFTTGAAHEQGVGASFYTTHSF